ncbi:hypothetical protein HDU97_007836 [Phlyctochytrium planicorne]|nr:hypothetical protein HDU97_007836 [Phlyctochytrium planicorne]
MPLDPKQQYQVQAQPPSPTKHSSSSHPHPAPASQPIATLRLTPEALAAIRANPSNVRIRFTNAPPTRSTSKSAAANPSNASGLIIGNDVFEFNRPTSTAASSARKTTSSVPPSEVYRVDPRLASKSGTHKMVFQGKVGPQIVMKMTLSQAGKLRVQKAIEEEEKKKEHGAVILNVEAVSKGASGKRTSSSSSSVSSKLRTTMNSASTIPSASIASKSSPSLLSRNGALPSSSSRPKPLSPEAEASLRKKLVHLIAPKPISLEDILQKVGASLESQVMEILPLIAKSQANGQYCLKASSYKEVYPFEWAPYTHKDVELACQNAKINFQLLKLAPDAPEYKNIMPPSKTVSPPMPRQALPGEKLSPKDASSISPTVPQPSSSKRKREKTTPSTATPTTASAPSTSTKKGTKSEMDVDAIMKEPKRRKTMNSLSSSVPSPPLAAPAPASSMTSTPTASSSLNPKKRKAKDAPDSTPATKVKKEKKVSSPPVLIKNHSIGASTSDKEVKSSSKSSVGPRKAGSSSSAASASSSATPNVAKASSLKSFGTPSLLRRASAVKATQAIKSIATETMQLNAAAADEISPTGSMGSNTTSSSSSSSKPLSQQMSATKKSSAATATVTSSSKPSHSKSKSPARERTASSSSSSALSSNSPHKLSYSATASKYGNPENSPPKASSATSSHPPIKLVFKRPASAAGETGGEAKSKVNGVSRQDIPQVKKELDSPGSIESDSMDVDHHSKPNTAKLTQKYKEVPISAIVAQLNWEFERKLKQQNDILALVQPGLRLLKLREKQGLSNDSQKRVIKDLVSKFSFLLKNDAEEGEVKMAGGEKTLSMGELYEKVRITVEEYHKVQSEMREIVEKSKTWMRRIEELQAKNRPLVVRISGNVSGGSRTKAAQVNGRI